VAAGFVLQVVEPHSNGLGGEVLAALAGQGVVVVNGQGPAAAAIERFADLVPGSGLLSACVRGAFDAWMLLLEGFGTRTVGEVLAPAPRTLWRTPALVATYRRLAAEAEAAGGDREQQIEAARAALSPRRSRSSASATVAC